MGLASFNRMRREAEQAKAAAAENESEQPEAPVNTSPNIGLKTAEIKEKLSSLGIEFNSSAKKDELLSLLDGAENLQLEQHQDDESHPETEPETKPD